MPQKVTQTAQLQCDKGTIPSQLMVTSQSFCKASDKLIATENDIQPNMNILPFGNCKLKYPQLPCTPQTNKWQDTATKDTINDYKLLTEKSSCQCAMGGKITITNVGHTENHETA